MARMRLIWAVLLVVMCSSALSAQSLAGDWQGILSGTRPLRLVVHIEPADGTTWKATLASIDQSPDWGASLPVDSVAVQGVNFKFAVPTLRGTFDAVALHPYTAKPANVIKLVKLARDVMRAYGDGKRPIWITELSFPAAKGKVDHPFGFETTQSGQVKRLKASLRSLAKQRRKLHVERVFWYAWLTTENRTSSFSWSGLRRLRDGRIVDSSALPAFTGVAEQLNGCAHPVGHADRCA